MKIPQIIAQAVIAVSLNPILALHSEEQLEREELKKIGRGECKYTERYKDNDLFTDRLGEYCEMPEEYFEMFFLLRRGAKECRKCEDNKRIVKLKYLCGSDSPRKWMNYAIFYSLEKRALKMSTDVFIGVALYSQYYNVTGKHRDLLIDNLFELYIKRKIFNPPTRSIFRSIKRALLGGKDSLYSKIYTSNGKDLRDGRELALLEGMMKMVLLAILRRYGLPFSYESRTGNLRIYKKDTYSLEDWCSKREIMRSGEVFSFSNVVMDRVPENCISDDEMKILLTLIGMVRTGKNIVSVRCRDWFSGSFQCVIELVNTNRNLVGVAELHNSMDFDGMLGGIKSQLRYLEVIFDNRLAFTYVAALKFINSLNNEIAIDVSLSHRIVVSVIEVLLSNPKIKHILSLRIENAWEDDEFEARKFVLASKKIIGIEMYNCGMSLEELLLDDDFRAFRDKLRVLEVSSVGNIESVADADLRSLELDRLHIRALYGNGAVMDFGQLVSRGIITGKYFKYLVFMNNHHKNKQGLVDLRNRLGEREWPVVLTSFKPPGAENVDYSCVCCGCFYELHVSSERN